uniref:Uncharacterized protein n=1 Tax=Anguilla anguilla TaxID=7936 RepID=A0A0E9P6J5_ANGAN
MRYKPCMDTAYLSRFKDFQNSGNVFSLFSHRKYYLFLD